MSNSVQLHRGQPTRLPHPWDSPGKNTGVGCHFLLQCMKVKSESEIAQSCLTLSNPMDCSPPGSSFHGIFQARVLEWGAPLAHHRCYLKKCIHVWMLGGWRNEWTKLWLAKHCHPRLRKVSQRSYQMQSLEDLRKIHYLKSVGGYKFTPDGGMFRSAGKKDDFSISM